MTEIMLQKMFNIKFSIFCTGGESIKRGNDKNDATKKLNSTLNFQRIHFRLEPDALKDFHALHLGTIIFLTYYFGDIFLNNHKIFRIFE